MKKCVFGNFKKFKVLFFHLYLFSRRPDHFPILVVDRVRPDHVLWVDHFVELLFSHVLQLQRCFL